METSIINGVKELFELSIQIPGAIFRHNPQANCVSVYDFLMEGKAAYKYNFESYYNANPESLKTALIECREYVNSLKK